MSPGVVLRPLLLHRTRWIRVLIQVALVMGLQGQMGSWEWARLGLVRLEEMNTEDGQSKSLETTPMIRISTKFDLLVIDGLQSTPYMYQLSLPHQQLPHPPQPLPNLPHPNLKFKQQKQTRRTLPHQDVHRPSASYPLEYPVSVIVPQLQNEYEHPAPQHPSPSSHLPNSPRPPS